MTYSFVQKTNDSADIIINKYIEALGGIEKLGSLKTIYMEGIITVGAGQKRLWKVWIINQKERRTESTLNGFTSWNILHNDSAWNYNPGRGQKFPEPLPSDMVKIDQPELDLEGTLVDYKAKGYKVEYRGIDQIEGSDAYKIEETINENVTRTYYIDLDSYLVIRLRSKFTTKRRTNYSNVDYGNYQKSADGYMFPMQMNNTKFKIVKVNTNIPDSLFIPKK